MKAGNGKILAAVLALALLMLCGGAGAEEAAPIELRDCTADGEYQYIEMGYYPYTSTGSEEPVLWRVLSVSDDVALLRSEYAIDTCKGNKYSKPDEILKTVCEQALGTLMESGSVLTSSIPSEFDVSSEFYGYSERSIDESRMVRATPYSASTDMLIENGYAGYWTYSGKKISYVGPNGAIIPVKRAMNLGVVPMITASVDQLRLDSGSGTKKDPYRSSYSQRNLWFEKNMEISFFELERHIYNPNRKRIPVYSGPGEDYYLPEGAMLTRHETKVKVLAREGSWLLIEYMVTGDNSTPRTNCYKTGYVYEHNVVKKSGQYDADALPYKSVSAVTNTDATLYDDRNLKSQPLYVLEEGRKVRILGHVEYNDILLAYVEADIYDQKARGFVRLEQLEAEEYDIGFMTAR